MIGTALITGVTGQDGRYAAANLLSKGYRVIGTSRAADAAGERLGGLAVDLRQWDLRDQAALESLLRSVQPQEVYNFAAYSTGTGMYDEPVAIGDTNGLAVTRILDAIRATGGKARFCQASSSEMFGVPVEFPQSEDTRFNPRSPYGAAKLYAHTMINIYRQRYGLFACSAILFNHESPLRGADFVTKKVASAAAGASLGLVDSLPLGNLEARRDWSFAGDTVEAMRLMLRAEAPSDYVVASGVTHSVRDLCELAFSYVGLDYRRFVREDRAAFRSPEPVPLVGDPAKARRLLGWECRTSFPDMVRMMVDAELDQLRRM